MKKPVKYLTNKELLPEVIRCKESGRMSEALAKMLMKLVKKYGRKSNFIGYTYNDDMQAYAMMEMVRHWHKFNEEKYTNAFAYYTQLCHNSFIQFLNKERRQRDIRDELQLKNGLSASYGYEDRMKVRVADADTE